MATTEEQIMHSLRHIAKTLDPNYKSIFELEAEHLEKQCPNMELTWSEQHRSVMCCQCGFKISLEDSIEMVTGWAKASVNAYMRTRAREKIISELVSSGFAFKHERPKSKTRKIPGII